VVIVGYNDAGSYWIVKNSWGPTWNGDGYFKVGYGECSIEDYVYWSRQNGFDSQFTSNYDGWAKHRGKWKLRKTNYFVTTGKDNMFSSIGYNSQYYPVEFEARMKRAGCTSCSNNIVIRGTGTKFTAAGDWKNSYTFQDTNNGNYSVWKINKFAITALQGWTSSSAINKGGFNTLKVIAKGKNMQFFINGTLVWSGSDSDLKAGRVGIQMYRYLLDGDKLTVDWANATTNASLVAAPESFVLGEELEGGDIYMSP
jgi:hypothetical protein